MGLLQPLRRGRSPKSRRWGSDVDAPRPHRDSAAGGRKVVDCALAVAHPARITPIESLPHSSTARSLGVT
jgi:hypothetical protein